MIYMTSISPHTSSRHPQIWSRQRQTNRHHPDTPRHRRFYFLEGTGKKAISEQAWLLCIFTDIFGINTSPDTLRLRQRIYPDTPRHNPDTPRHRGFYAIQGIGRQDNIWLSWPNTICLQYISTDGAALVLHNDILLQNPLSLHTIKSNLISKLWKTANTLFHACNYGIQL